MLKSGQTRLNGEKVDKRGKKKYNQTDMTEKGKTIIAIATAAGPGAIGIIRISGPDSIKGVKRAFTGFKGSPKPNTMYYGTLTAGEYKDKCMAAYFKAPHSYTGEDGVEIYCHGSYALMQGIVLYFMEKEGFVQAEGGDFTARAFKNGKLDLTEAEGVYDIINAETESEIRGAYSLLSGKLKSRIEDIQKAVISARADTEAALDYPEEDVEEQTSKTLEKSLRKIKSDLDELIKSYRTGRLMRDGVKVALIGRPNAGKSSLMNALLGYERAIVTEEKGTTRDTLTESYVYKGINFMVTDTAGLREAESLPEKMGISRAYAALDECDEAVFVAEKGMDDLLITSMYEKLLAEGKKVFLAENKSDLTFDGDSAPVKKETGEAEAVAAAAKAVKNGAISVSAKTGEGIDNLKEALYKACGLVSTKGAQLNNARQYGAALNAKTAIDRALENVGSVPTELISADLNEAYAALGRITGITGSDAVAEEIFKKFCVGK